MSIRRITVSAPEPGSAPDAPIVVQPARCAADIVELGGYRGNTQELERIARLRGLELPQLGRLVTARGETALSVRPDRWLILSEPDNPGARAAQWQAACAGFGIAVDQSSGLSAFHLGGGAARDVLARQCGVDLASDALPVGCAAATIMAQVSVIIAALPCGMLLLSPSTTARHFYGWLVSTAHPFGVGPGSQVTLPEVLRSEIS
jgi:heterotetrameric sarcosine oxidase gamma subunit